MSNAMYREGWVVWDSERQAFRGFGSYTWGDFNQARIYSRVGDAKAIVTRKNNGDVRWQDGDGTRYSWHKVSITLRHGD